MEYLSKLFQQVSKQIGFEFHPHCKKLGLTHLQFADDSIIFCKAKPSSLQALVDAFNVFTRCSGLKANMNKSQIVFRGECAHIQQECLDITGFLEGHLPFKYLGMLIISSKVSKAALPIEKLRLTLMCGESQL